jgi:hypothetical protein
MKVYILVKQVSCPGGHGEPLQQIETFAGSTSYVPVLHPGFTDAVHAAEYKSKHFNQYDSVYIKEIDVV